MVKTSKILAFSLFLTLACSTAAFADGNAFTPLNFDNASYNDTAVRTSATSTTSSSTTLSGSAVTQEVTGSSDMQDAILKLDNAQVDVRNDLLNIKAKYADVDAQYKTIKNERNDLFTKSNG